MYTPVSIEITKLVCLLLGSEQIMAYVHPVSIEITSIVVFYSVLPPNPGARIQTMIPNVFTEDAAGAPWG